jgi:hypothetical protein
MRIGSISSMLVKKRKHVDNRSVYNSSREVDFVSYATCKDNPKSKIQNPKLVLSGAEVSI